MICPPRPWAASAHSITALNCGYPTPVFFLVVHTLPGPMPTLIISAPDRINSSTISPVTTFPAWNQIELTIISHVTFLPWALLVNQYFINAHWLLEIWAWKNMYFSSNKQTIQFDTNFLYSKKKNLNKGSTGIPGPFAFITPQNYSDKLHILKVTAMHKNHKVEMWFLFLYILLDWAQN